MATITKLDDKVLSIKTTTETEEFVKKTTLEGQRVTLIEEHEKALAEIDEKLNYFKS